ncbi:hypothetical protein [uncultured Marixanthomonas sp.]|uniref:hypothetical protein n=1 Tax=uncultured Marixanthomonas sp. TaxID=757245 RepID=UPI0030D6F12D|tara:strand:- start:14868 stop:15578 length:711 start_codon:yes stop_codon:yes gene_type:complete
MNAFLNFLLFSFFTTSIVAQVGINTTTPDDGSLLQVDGTTGAFVPPRVTTTQMNAIPTPLKGATVFNTTTNAIFVYNGSIWQNQTKNEISNLTLYRNFSGGEALQGDSTFNNFPIGDGVNEVTSIDTSVFEVVGDGKIKVLVDGTYQFSAGLSVRNLKGGQRKYILAIFKNTSRFGYLARGFASIPTPATNIEYWGVSGVFQLTLNAGDIIEVQYYVNNDGVDLAADFLNIGVIKM